MCQELPADVKIAFYRITQEVFNNIAKHAEATSVEVALESSAHRVALTIQDNGVGFDLQKDKLASMGISIMQERAAEVGAQLEIESQVSRGTRVNLSWIQMDEGTNHA